MLRTGLKQRFTIGKYCNLFIEVNTVESCQLVCHTGFNAINEMSALGVKTDFGLYLLFERFVCKETLTPVAYVTELPVAVVHLVINREHATEDALIAPVEHITGVGTHLKEAGEILGIKVYSTVAGAVVINTVFIGLYDIPLWAHELNIEHTAQHSGVVIAVAGDECLEPHRLAKIICRVVKMQIYPLLWQGTPYQQCAQGGAVGRYLGILLRYGSREYGKYDGQQGEYSFLHICFWISSFLI